MRHLRTYEHEYYYSVDSIQGYKVGDIVVCIDPADGLYMGKRYKILDIYIPLKNPLFVLYDLDEGEELRNAYYLNRFISEVEYNSNKYNL